MERKIVRDVMFLSRKAEPATREDLPVARDLMDTLAANRGRCVGMAANMVGAAKRIIIVSTAPGDLVMFNPKILRKTEPYETSEGCLSLDGVRPTKRYRSIEVEYTDLMWKKRKGTFKGFEAQIIQHEMDHLEGILI